MYRIPVELGRRFSRLHEETRPLADKREIAETRALLRKKPDSEWISLTSIAEQSGLADVRTLSGMLDNGLFPEYERRLEDDFEDKRLEMPFKRKKRSLRGAGSKFAHESLVEKVKNHLRFEAFLKEHFYTSTQVAKIFRVGSRQALKSHFENGFPFVIVKRGSLENRYVPKKLVAPDNSEVQLSRDVLKNWLESRGTEKFSSTFNPRKPRRKKVVEPPLATPEPEPQVQLPTPRDYVFLHELKDLKGFPKNCPFFGIRDWLRSRGIDVPARSEKHPKTRDDLYVLPMHVKGTTLREYLQENMEAFREFIIRRKNSY